MSGLFVRIDEQQKGPYSSNELKSLAANGEFKSHHLVFDEDSQEWIQAGSFYDLKEIFQIPKEVTRKRTVYAIGGGKGGVGKTSLTASIGIALAAFGQKVVIVDADLGGANLHTCMGILEPKYTFYDFYTLQRDSLEDIQLETPVENLSLISGACGTLGLANPRYSQKLRFISELKKIDADYILLDLGAGSSYNVIDFFLAADTGIVVTTPEPMAIQESFNFVKVSLLRKLMREFRTNQDVISIMERFAFSKPGRLESSMSEILKEIRSMDKKEAEKFEKILQELNFRLILNMVHSQKEAKDGAALRTALEDLLYINIDYMGYVDYDTEVRKAVKELKPFVIANPKSKASKSIAQLVSVGLLGKNGWNGYRERKKVLRHISYDAQEYPTNNITESDTICSVKCFYWGECEYQSGGHPCPVRHLDPIFKM